MICAAATFYAPFWFGGPQLSQISLLPTPRYVTGTVIKKSSNDVGQSGV